MRRINKMVKKIRIAGNYGFASFEACIAQMRYTKSYKEIGAIFDITPINVSQILRSIDESTSRYPTCNIVGPHIPELLKMKEEWKSTKKSLIEYANKKTFIPKSTLIKFFSGYTWNGIGKFK